MAKPRRPTPRARTQAPALAADPAEVGALATRLRAQLAAPPEALATLSAAAPAVAAAAVAEVGQAEGAAARELLVQVASEGGPAVAAAALGALAALNDSESVAALAHLAEAAPDKERRKDARRALFQLRSRGVEVPTAPSPTAGVAVIGQPRATLYRAIVSHLDGAGSRLLWLYAERALGGVWWVAAVLNSEAGMKDMTVRDTTRKRVATQEAEMRVATGFTLVDVPVAYAQWLVQEAVALNAESGFPLPTEYLAWRELIGKPPEPIERPLVYERVSRFETKMRPELLRDSVHLFEEPELEGWFLGYREVKPYATELRRLSESRLILSPESEEQRLDRVLNQAIREYYTAPRRRALQRALEETGYIFASTERLEAAKQAVAAAVEIADNDPLVLQRHPFVRTLVQRSIELAIRAERAGVDPTQYDRSPYDPIGG